MDLGQMIFIASRLVLGALATFLAIMLWSRTRDTAWMLVIVGIVTSYAESIYSIMRLFGMDIGVLSIGSMSLLSILLPCLPLAFFTAALAVMVARKYRRSKTGLKEDT